MTTKIFFNENFPKYGNWNWCLCASCYLLPVLVCFPETLGAEPVLDTCKRTIPTHANYDSTSQVLSVNLDYNVTDVAEISLYWCNSKKSQIVSSQNCSAVDLGLGPLTFNESVIITFSPICTGSTPPLDYSILMAVDFNFISERCAQTISVCTMKAIP